MLGVMYRRPGDDGVVFGLQGGPYTGGPRTFSQADLPPYLIERLRAVAEGRGGPAPILECARTRTALPLVVTAQLVGEVWLVGRVALHHFGNELDLYQGPGAAALYALAGAVLALAVWLVWRDLKARLPRRGAYLLPLDVVEVGRDTVTVTPMGNLRQVAIEDERGQPALVLTFDHGARHVFPVASVQDAKRAHAQMERVQDTLDTLSSSMDLEQSLDLDPFFALRGVGSHGQDHRVRGPSSRSPLRRAAGWTLVAALGIVSGVCVWKIRNMASDQALFDRAAIANTTQSYERYLAVGQLCRQKAMDGLQRVRLREEERLRQRARCLELMSPGDCDYEIEIGFFPRR